MSTDEITRSPLYASLDAHMKAGVNRYAWGMEYDEAGADASEILIVMVHVVDEED